MQLKWFEDFVALAATRSFSRAAELRNVTPPALMRCLARCASLIAPGTTEDKRSPLKLEDSGSTVSKLDVDMPKFLSEESLKYKRIVDFAKITE
ncbi:HTH-type transcriptional regulator YjiE [Polaromonas vacuolata]|uniref:HTH-type transcriptional regulator YjiE n=1 Tax=Polaromonas vacuolata TaxID=37448 RepID=A0A6H2HB07_9BURK|nr:LysR family transcriptional regulator [Polaromonas vacuolata]QJC56947.1 HTH-type transcriptional regulator YjiE [Polaromonas vacuolata]